MRFLSPLRYPGGKAKIAPFLASLLLAQQNRATTYAEPFAGGAGAALQLLSDGVVQRIALNDLNEGVAAFWRAILDETDRFVRAVERVALDLATWHRQRELYLDAQTEPFEKGFATFFLNRTNRSGILGARPIGGLDQTGAWKLDARFNKSDLRTRITYLSTLRDRISVTAEDGRAFIERIDHDGEGTFFYVDPPYLKQGEDLYLANMTYRDHVNLARTLMSSRSSWVLTYDRDDRIPEELYAGLPCATFSVSHTAARQRVGNEYLVVPGHVEVPSLAGFGPRLGVWLDGRDPETLRS